MTFKRVTLLLNKIHNVLTFLPLIHVLNSKNPNAASDIWTPKQFKFPTFYLLRSGIQDKIVWPSWECSPSPLSSRRSCVECHEVFFRFIISRNIFCQFKQNIFLSKHAKCVVLIYRGLVSTLFDLCLCGRRRASVHRSVGEGRRLTFIKD